MGVEVETITTTTMMTTTSSEFSKCEIFRDTKRRSPESRLPFVITQ